MSIRLKLLVISLLFCVALASVIFAAANTVRAYQQLTQRHQQIETGDTDTISPWMTLSYIAHVYHIPESCLLQSLHLPADLSKKYTSLRLIADHSHRSIDGVLHDVRSTIQLYRQHHLVCSTPTPAVQLFRAARYPPASHGRELTQ